jgi:thioredoxin-dependent peroxiredoxin
MPLLRQTILLLIALSFMTSAYTSGAAGQENSDPGRRRSQGQQGKNPPSAPKVGDDAPNFTLNTADGKSIELHKLTSQQPVVLLVLRGWPGYQCPLCGRQAGEFIAKKAELEKQGVRVLMIYTGPKEKLADYAKEFLTGYKITLPEGFDYVTDPDYTFTSAWGLRWAAEGETAYPSTYIIDKDNKIKFAKTSTTHGDRASAADVLKTLKKMSAESK